jgi:homogentisate 1,2-dioxygenase
MPSPLAPPRGTITFSLPEYQDRTPFFNMYDSVGSLEPFTPVEVVGYPAHTVELVKAQGDDAWNTADADDELILVVDGEVSCVFCDNGSRIASARAVEGEILLLPRGLEYQLSGRAEEPGLFIHFRTRRGVA